MTETYLYDESGQRIRKQVAYSSTVGDTVTYVPFVFYEQAVSAGGSVVTRHYSVNGERVAVRVGGALYYVYRDQVGSTILATDAITNVVSSRGYYAFGATRRSSSVTPTDRRFTGQAEDGTGLYYYNSRYYDPQLGQFISPDTIVPDPGNLLSYNCYLYGFGNPVKFSDPSGHDPMDAAWEQEFSSAHGRSPNEQDRRDRLYSLMVMGHGVAGTWTEDDWTAYSQDRNLYWNDPMTMEPQLGPGIKRFGIHTWRLASHYTQAESELFVKAFAFVFASFSMGNPAGALAGMANPNIRMGIYPSLFEGNQGWRDEFRQPGDPNQAHRYAAFVYVGYFPGKESGYVLNYVRDGLTDWGPFQKSPEDLALGNMAADHGEMLRSGRLPVQLFSTYMYLHLLGWPMGGGGYD